MSARRLALALLLLAAFACAAEWAVGRWIMAPRSDLLATPFGRLFRPGSYYIQSAEGWGEFSANRDGFLDRDWAATRRGPRAVLFGDSFGQGLQVRDEARFSEVAEHRVPGLEVLNAAAAGRSPFHYALFAARYQAAFHPDLLIVQLNDGDLTDVDNERENATARTEFEATADAAASGRLWRRSDPRAPIESLRKVARSSALLSYLHARLERLSRRERERLSAKLRGIRPDLRDVVALPPTPHAMALLDSLIGEVARVNPNLVLVYVPHLHYFHEPPEVAYPLRRDWFHELAARRGLPLVDPSDAMLEEYRRTHEPLHGFANTQPGAGHLNARGHRVLGERLAALLVPGTKLAGSGSGR